jgi:hypothetical protein
MQAPDFRQTGDPSTRDPSIATLSRDGYVRLTYESFQRTKIVHFHSGMDDDRPSSDGEGATFSAITGYTEWVSHSWPAITIGWDWKMIGKQSTASFIHSGIPGSNLMFVSQRGEDVGTQQTSLLLLGWLDTFCWQTETLKAISIGTHPVNFDSC